MKLMLLKSLKPQKRYLSVLVILAIILLCSSAKAEVFTFTQDEAADIVMKLDVIDKQKKLIDVCRAEYSQCVIKGNSLTEIIGNQYTQISDCKVTVKKLNEEIKVQKEAYEKQIDEIEPGFFDNLKVGSVGAVVGVIITIVAFLL